MRFPFLQLSGLGLVLISWSAAGQNALAKKSPPAISSLRSLTRNAGYIFDGTVLSGGKSRAERKQQRGDGANHIQS